MPTNSVVSDFLDKCKVSHDNGNDNYYYQQVSGQQSGIFEFWDNLSYKKKKELVSAFFWNRYPTCSWDRKKKSNKIYGPYISCLVRRIIMSGENKDIQLLKNNSEGVFSLFFIDFSNSECRTKAAKRLSTSVDVRVRLRCAHIIQNTDLVSMLDDPAPSVRNVAYKRLGLDNCYKYILPDVTKNNSLKKYSWSERWYISKAIKLCSDKEAKNLYNNIDNISHSLRDSVKERYLSNLSKDEILFHLNENDNSYRISEIFASKNLS